MNTNTMRKAFLKWQASENQREAAWEELNHHYLALLQEAEAAHLDTGSGLLQAAPVVLKQPLDARTFQAQHRLNNAFALLGKGFFRRAPTSLQIDIRHYAARINKTCRHYHRLSARLRLARQVIRVLQQHPELTSPQSFRLTLYNPEDVWVALLLRQRRFLIQQTEDISHAQTWRTKVLVCRRWLQLLQNSLTSQMFVYYHNVFRQLTDTDSTPERRVKSRLVDWHRHLEHLLNLANRQASRIIIRHRRQQRQS